MTTGRIRGPESACLSGGVVPAKVTVVDIGTLDRVREGEVDGVAPGRSTRQGPDARLRLPGPGTVSSRTPTFKDSTYALPPQRHPPCAALGGCHIRRGIKLIRFILHPLGIVGVYLVAVSLPLLAGPWGLGHALLTVFHLGIAGACLAKARSAEEPPPAASWIPLLALPFLYWEIVLLNQGITTGYRDPIVAGWERAVFGSPATELAGRLPSVWLSEALHFAYVTFYPIIYVPPAILFLRGRHREFVVSAAAISAVAAVCYAAFVYFPVQGPRYFGPPVGVPTGPMRSLALVILESGSSRGSAFPSSHLAFAACQAVLTLRFQPRLGIVVATLAAGLGIGAVYGGFHYGIDMVAGGLVGVGAGIAILKVSETWEPQAVGEAS